MDENCFIKMSYYLFGKKKNEKVKKTKKKKKNEKKSKK